VRELLSLSDALERHLAARVAFATVVDHGVATALRAYDAVAPDPEHTPLDALREYTREVDVHAHETSPERNARTTMSLDAAAFEEAFGGLPGTSGPVDHWMSALLDREAHVRAEVAHARGGAHRYSLADGALESLWRESLADARETHPVVRGARWYFDAIFLHPYDDGNARLARALFTSALGAGPATALRALVWLPKSPGDRADFWRFVTVAARGAAALARRRTHARLR
jgi:hypothetical protein